MIEVKYQHLTELMTVIDNDEKTCGYTHIRNPDHTLFFDKNYPDISYNLWNDDTSTIIVLMEYMK